MFLAAEVLKKSSLNNRRLAQKPEDFAGLIEQSGPSCAFFHAIAGGEFEQTRLMLDVNPAMASGWAGSGITPLGMAAFTGQSEIARYLLSLGARVDQVSRDSKRETALHCAVARGQIEVARLLLEWGADVNARQIGDFTPLHTTAQTGDAEMAKLLLAFAADIDARTSEGGTALSIAIEWGHHDVAALLRE